MGTIEEAAKRLEQLRRAGVVSPAVEAQAAPAMAAPQAELPQPDEHASGDIIIRLPTLEPEPEHTPAPDEWADAGQNGERRSRAVNVDLLGMQRRSLLVPGAPRSQLEEEFRLIKRPLLENIRSVAAIRPKRANLIMITSAVPGEGKTQSAINLAVSMAMEMDRTVLLVEADVLRPSLLERMGISAPKGLMDLLAGEVEDLSDVLLRTNIPKLSVLPAGGARSSATEMLASSAMENLLDDLAGRYSDRVIIFDTPPLLSTTESRVLATHMGQVVMVVEAYATPLSVIKQAYAAVETHPVVLSVLNKYSGPRSGEGYGYYAP